MTSKFSIDNRELLQRISSGEAIVGIDFGNLIVRELAAFRLAAMDSSESVELPLDYLQGHKDGLEWAAQLAEANHPEKGDWLYDDPIELAKAIRKGPDMPPAQPVADSEPVIVVGDDGGDALSYRRLIQSFEPGTKLYLHAQPAPVVPENCVTAEHRRVIEMLLSVCGAAFELADDSCQQDVDGEECHVVPSDAFQKLSDALDEIENTLPTEDTDRPDVFLVWSAVPRAALKSILHAQPAQVVPDDYQRLRELYHAQEKRLFKIAQRIKGPAFDKYSHSPSQAIDVLESAIFGEDGACRAAMLAAAPQSPGSEPATVPGKWIPVSERMPEVGVKVLCFPVKDEPIHATFNGQLWLQDISWSGSDEPIDNVIPTSVTHWMPLPAAPQEVK
ncbi:DUF551 domain-containing protein [Klebsiella pneumoniae]|nr:DUF551 domain-containing protein [Klebsiella pneumoniae]